MSEEKKEAIPPPPILCGEMWLYHPSGVKVKLPVPVIMGRHQYEVAFHCIREALEAGFMVHEPGLEAGEEREDIGWVCRLDHEKDGETTATVLLYSSNQAMTWSFLRRYMNTKEDIQAFEAASGLKYDNLPPYPGNDHPQRGASAKTDKFIVKAPASFGLVWRHNPRYKDAPAGQDTRSLTEKRKRDFVRWASQTGEAPQAAPTAKQAAGKSQEPAATLDLLHKFNQDIVSCENLEELRVVWAAVVAADQKLTGQKGTGPYQTNLAKLKDDAKTELTNRAKAAAEAPYAGGEVPWS